MALLILPKGRLCVSGQKQMCHLCVWKKLFLKNLRWKKIKIQKRWLLGRLSDGSFVSLLYVYFCRSFLQVSSFRLAGNGSQLAVRAGFRSTKLSSRYKDNLLHSLSTCTSTRMTARCC